MRLPRRLRLLRSWLLKSHRARLLTNGCVAVKGRVLQVGPLHGDYVVGILDPEGGISCVGEYGVEGHRSLGRVTSEHLFRVGDIIEVDFDIVNTSISLGSSRTYDCRPSTAEDLDRVLRRGDA